MKNFVKLSLALAVTVPFLSACSENKAAATAKVEKTMDAAKGTFVEMKDKLVKMTETQMGDVGKQVDDLKKKADMLTGEKKTELEGLLKTITAKKDDMMKMFGDMKGMAEGAGFDGMKAKLESGISELKKLVEAAMAKLK